MKIFLHSKILEKIYLENFYNENFYEAKAKDWDADAGAVDEFKEETKWQDRVYPFDIMPWPLKDLAEHFGQIKGDDPSTWVGGLTRETVKTLEKKKREKELLDKIVSEDKAQGGRIGAQEGGLMNLGGLEKDYRQEGGFVPIGGQEKADDVPARLSKNEFVFTADAVRAAGGGDIDEGAAVMENLMENLEAGGKVSEESQGLEGARGMFANAQALEKRII